MKNENTNKFTTDELKFIKKVMLYIIEEWHEQEAVEKASKLLSKVNRKLER